MPTLTRINNTDWWQRDTTYCFICKKLIDGSIDDGYYIKINRKKIIYLDGMEKEYYEYHIECYAKCAKVRKPVITDGLIGYRLIRFDSEIKSKINACLFPNLVDDEDLPYLKLSKNINDMKVKELKLELKKRDFDFTGNKADYIRALRRIMNCDEEYVENYRYPWAKMKAVRKIESEKLSIGYCRESEKKYKLNIPIYLKQIVDKYYGLIQY